MFHEVESMKQLHLRGAAEEMQSICLHRRCQILFLALSLSAEDEIDTGCGSLQELTASSGEFSSGNYPSSYDNGMSCSWHITVEANKVPGDTQLSSLAVSCSLGQAYCKMTYMVFLKALCTFIGLFLYICFIFDFEELFEHVLQGNTIFCFSTSKCHV